MFKSIMLGLVGCVMLSAGLASCGGDTRTARQVAEGNNDQIVTLTPKELGNVKAFANAEFSSQSLTAGNKTLTGALQRCEAVDSDRNSFVSCTGVMPKLQDTPEGTQTVILETKTIYVNFVNGAISYKNPVPAPKQ